MLLNFAVPVFTYVAGTCGRALLLTPTVETEGKNSMLLGSHQKTIPVLHLPGGDLKVEAGATSAVKATTSFLYQGVTTGALVHGEVLDVLQSSMCSLAKWASSRRVLMAGPCR